MEVIQQYEAIYEQFYKIVELSHLETIKKLFDVPIRLKDIHLVFKVHQMSKEGTNFSAKIAEATMMSRSIFSNYLLYAEKMKLIKRYRDEQSYKYMRVELDELGQHVYDQVMTYYRGLYNYLKDNLKTTELLQTIQTTYIISNLLSDEKPTFKTNKFQMPKTLDALIKAFDRIFFYMHKLELSFIKDYELNASITELHVMTFIDVLTYHQLNQPKHLSEKSMLHFSTISSMLKSLEKKGYVFRQPNELDKRIINMNLTKTTTNIVRDFMKLRIEQHQFIQNHLTKKAYTKMVHAYELLQSYTESYDQIKQFDQL